jgi:CheY-like chemotaxis protein/GAF domain-containing protein
MDSAGVADQFVAALQALADLRIVNNPTEATAALKAETFDLVICGDSELLPLARVATRQRSGGILEGVDQGACIVTRDGELAWANARLRSYPAEVGEAVRQACTELLAELAAEVSGDKPPRARQRTLHIGSAYYLDLSVSALPDIDGQIHEALGLFSDTSEMSRMRERLSAIDAAGRELVALDVDATAQLDVGERLQRLEANLIRYCRDLLHFTHFSVMILDPKTNHLDTVLSGGFSEEAIRGIDIYARETGNGISGYVAATGRSYICPDITSDPLYLPGFECAASSLTVPLRLLGRIVGILNVESDKPNTFTEEDRQVAEVFGRYIAVALHTLKLIASERSDMAGQVTADVSAELTQPLDAILADVSRILAAPLSPDDLRRRLRGIIDRVDDAKRVLQQVGRGPAIRGLLPDTTAIDPILKGKRVLVADDEDIIRDTIADVMSKAGAVPVTAQDGEDAIAMLRSQRFDIVLSDIKMPNKNGYEVFAATKEVNSACPVILITGFGYDPDHAIVRASREGLSAVLFKPFKVEQLMAAIHKALAPKAM